MFLPLGMAAALAHWSLVRAGKHYVSDFLVGGSIGLLIAFAALRLRPPATVTDASPEPALPVPNRGRYRLVQVDSSHPDEAEKGSGARNCESGAAPLPEVPRKV